MYRKISNKELSEKAAQLTALQAEAAALADQIDAIKGEITAELDRQGRPTGRLAQANPQDCQAYPANPQDLTGDKCEAEELTVPGFLIRWTKYASSRFDSRAFKKDHPALSEEYTRQTEGRRFSLAAN